MSALATGFAVSCGGKREKEVSTLQRDTELNQFLADVERRALRMAEISLRNRDDAMDLVQDAMIKLVKRYADKGQDEWPPLFYRILQNGIRDFQRRQAVRNRVMVWFGRSGQDNEDYDPVAAAPDPMGRAPEQEIANDEAMTELESAIHGLAPRQREAFMLRTFEGLDVRSTATAMGVSEGSVKTHYSRAVHALREILGEHWQ